MKWKAWSKKRKILFVGVLAAVVVLAAGTAVWLLWGQEKPGYKKLSFSCENGSVCPHLDQWGRCPLLLEAPDEP